MTASAFRFLNPVKILSGENSLDNIGSELHQLGAKRPLLLTDQGVSAAGLLDLVKAAVEAAGIEVGAVFDTVPADSSIATIDQAADTYRRSDCDSIVSVGGGSVLDTGKTVNIVISEAAASLRDLIGAKLRKPGSPYIAVPTTSGTGSEVTWASMILDEEKNRKLGFFSFLLFPNTAVLDPRMTLSLPPALTASTAMDALTHAIEGYICKNKNPFSDAHSVEAIALIRDNLTEVLQTAAQDSHRRAALANAACLAGISLANSGVAIVHALGHALGGVCRTPHGVAMNIFLPFGLEYNLSASAKVIGDLLLPLAGADTYAKTPESERAEATVAHIHGLKEKLFDLAGLPRTLKEAGVNKSDFEDIAKKAVSDAAATLNVVKPDREAMLGILERAY